MDKLLIMAIHEMSQLEDHKKHNELHEYGESRYEDLMELFDGIIKLARKGADQDAA